jgi:2-polyprenyl-3-methyl-5-hydroxy-6-metoxy-1,4-benzoquinol methylase
MAGMDRFLQQEDELGNLINTQASALHERMIGLDVESLGMPDHCLAYFRSSHSKRLFFSIETSAHLLYRSLKLVGKRPANVVIMDYGAGVGTLYMLAKMIGCAKVIYNDHLDDWRLSAQLIAEAAGIAIDHYIVGDIDACLNRLFELHLNCDVITSRNVIEHIYKLDVFYNTIYHRQPGAVIVSSTTANKQNPVSVIKHARWHKKWEKVYRGKRAVAVERQSHGLSRTKINLLAKATRGLATEDLKEAIEEYRRSGRLPNPAAFGSNTCDPSNGVWAEHLITSTDYRKLINEEHYTISFEPGFWDTHYIEGYMNTLGRLLNKVIAGGGKTAIMVAPFIYVIAIPAK